MGFTQEQLLTLVYVSFFASVLGHLFYDAVETIAKVIEALVVRIFKKQ